MSLEKQKCSRMFMAINSGAFLFFFSLFIFSTFVCFTTDSYLINLNFVGSFVESYGSLTQTCDLMTHRNLLSIQCQLKVSSEEKSKIIKLSEKLS